MSRLLPKIIQDDISSHILLVVHSLLAPTQDSYYRTPGHQGTCHYIVYYGEVIFFLLSHLKYSPPIPWPQQQQNSVTHSTHP